MISQRDLIEKIKIGEAVRVSNFLGKETETICVLYPYQSSVTDGVPHSNQINSYLKTTNYLGDEGHWAFVFVENDAVVVSKYKRSEKLDILASHEIQTTLMESLPKGFEPASCAAFADASVAKIEIRNRVFIALGKVQDEQNTGNGRNSDAVLLSHGNGDFTDPDSWCFVINSQRHSRYHQGCHQQRRYSFYTQNC